jgi:hypothetical protein
VTLTDLLTGATTDVFTAVDGEYDFSGLAAGTYTIAMVTPSASPGATNLGALYNAAGILIAYEGLNSSGHVVPAAGTASVNEVSDLVLGAGAGYQAEWYDFGELVYPASLISKQMFIGNGYPEFLPPIAMTPPPDWQPASEPGLLVMLGGGLVALSRYTWCARRRRWGLRAG